MRLSCCWCRFLPVLCVLDLWQFGFGLVVVFCFGVACRFGCLFWVFGLGFIVWFSGRGCC